MYKHGGARKGAGRKKGIGISYDIEKHCRRFIEEILLDDAIRFKATKQLSMKLDESSNDCLYIIKSEDAYKIGYSSNWIKRKKSYDTHLPKYKLVYLLWSEISFELESELHLMFQSNLIRGEWFALDEKDIVKAVSHCSIRIS